jgi:hypothetical protein
MDSVRLALPVAVGVGPSTSSRIEVMWASAMSLWSSMTSTRSSRDCGPEGIIVELAERIGSR